MQFQNVGDQINGLAVFELCSVVMYPFCAALTILAIPDVIVKTMYDGVYYSSSSR